MVSGASTQSLQTLGVEILVKGDKYVYPPVLLPPTVGTFPFAVTARIPLTSVCDYIVIRSHTLQPQIPPYPVTIVREAEDLVHHQHNPLACC